eukprot:gene35664-6485_t
MRAPLLFGCALPDTTGAVRWFNNSVALAINANSTNLRVVNGANATEHMLFAADISPCPALSASAPCSVRALFNLAERNITVPVPVPAAGRDVRDVWSGRRTAINAPFGAAMGFRRKSPRMGQSPGIRNLSISLSVVLVVVTGLVTGILAITSG